MTPSWSKRAEAGNGLPNLGLGGTLVTTFVTSYFAAKAAGVLLIIITQGRHAFFADGLRFKDWKHGIMSNGELLPFPGNIGLGLATFVIWMSFLLFVEWLAGFVPPILARCGLWGVPTARLIGGTLLVSLAQWFYTRDSKFPLIHPVPLSALIGGIVLLWKGVASVIRHVSFRKSSN
jgi:hypothetical protein